MNTNSPDNSGSAPAGPEHPRDRRIRRHKITALTVTLLLVFVAPVWMYLRLLLCWGDVNAFVCRQSYLAPLLLIVLAGVAIVLTMFVLMGYGSELEATGKIPAAPGAGLRRRIHHVRNAYRALPPRRQADVRQTFFLFVSTWGALFAFMVWFFFQIPALAAILMALVLAIVAALINRLFFT